VIDFVLSFDYELGWGLFDKVDPSYLSRNVVNSNKAVGELLQENERLEVPATWAIVGLMLPGPLDTNARLALLDAKFRRSKSASVAFARFDNTEACELLTVPPELFARITGTPGQEFASHTFSHLYLLEADAQALAEDFRLMAEACACAGVQPPRSLVMPKNQVTIEAVECAARNGIRIIRINADNWLYSTRQHGALEARIVRVLRYLDAFLPVCELFGGRERLYGVAATEGNFFFRPDTGLVLLDYLHYLRFRMLVTACRWRRRDVHMWTHPHNFGRNIERSVRNYRRILKYVAKLRSSGKLAMKNMGQLIE